MRLRRAFVLVLPLSIVLVGMTPQDWGAPAHRNPFAGAGFGSGVQHRSVQLKKPKGCKKNSPEDPTVVLGLLAAGAVALASRKQRLELGEEGQH